MMKRRMKITLIKTDFLFCLILSFFSTATLTVVNVASSDCRCSTLSTQLDKFKNNILKRRIRAVVFPQKAQFVLTFAFSKALLGGRPKGLLYAMEFDMYNPLPDTLEGWKPTVVVNNLKKQQNTSQPSKVDFLKTETNSFQNYTEGLTDHTLEENSLRTEDLSYYSFPTDETKEPNDLHFEWTHQPASFSDRVFRRDSHKTSNKFQGFDRCFHKMPYLKSEYKETRRFLSESNQKFTTFSSSDVNQNIRERRQIFKQLEIVGKFFKINMKKCLQRAMCELTSHFRPYGESLVEDILRLILIPSYGSPSPGRDDKFSANYSNGNCKQRFAKSCPYSILDLLTKK